jgi:hypothetical protein
VAAAARAGGMVAAAEARAEGRAVAAPCLGFFFCRAGDRNGSENVERLSW